MSNIYMYKLHLTYIKIQERQVYCYSIVLKVMEKFIAGIQTKGNIAEKVSSCYEKNRGSSPQRSKKCYMLHQSLNKMAAS